MPRPAINPAKAAQTKILLRNDEPELFRLLFGVEAAGPGRASARG